MPEPKRRYDGYGQPIAPLVDAREESLAQRPANIKALESLMSLLRERWADVLRRGWCGTITLDFIIDDGILAQEIRITEVQKHRIRE